jgi:hypothetical protein
MRKDPVTGAGTASLIGLAGYENDGVALRGQAFYQAYGVCFGAARSASAPAVRKQNEDIHREAQWSVEPESATMVFF